MSTTLLPCPFCNSEATFEYIDWIKRQRPATMARVS